MGKNKPMKTKLSVAGLVIACVACCAPLLLPLLAGTGLVAGIAAASFDSLFCGALAVGVLGVAIYWLKARSRTKAQSLCGCDTSCDPASDCGPTAYQSSLT